MSAYMIFFINVIDFFLRKAELIYEVIYNFV